MQLYNDPANSKIARRWRHRVLQMLDGGRHVKEESHAVLGILQNGTQFDALTRLKIDFQGLGFLIPQANWEAEHHCTAIRGLIFKLPALKELLVRLPRICPNMFFLTNEFMGYDSGYDSQEHEPGDPGYKDRYEPVLPLETLVINMSLCGEDGQVRNPERGAVPLDCLIEDELHVQRTWYSTRTYPVTTPPLVSASSFGDIKAELRFFARKMMKKSMVRIIWPRYLPQWGNAPVAPQTCSWDMFVDKEGVAPVQGSDTGREPPKLIPPYTNSQGHRRWEEPGEIRLLSPDADWTSKGKLVDYVDNLAFGLEDDGCWKTYE